MAKTKKARRGEVPQVPTVELGGKFWEMRFSHKAMRRFCSMTKCRMSTFDDALDDYANYAKLFWCIIWAQDEKVTLEDVNKWLDELDSMGTIVDLATTVLAAAMKRPLPPRDEDGEEEPEEDDGAGDDWDDEENPTGETTSP